MTAVAVPEIEPGTYSVREAARRLGIGKNLAYDLIGRKAYPFDAGRIRIEHYGSRIRIPIADVERHLGGQPAQTP